MYSFIVGFKLPRITGKIEQNIKRSYYWSPYYLIVGLSLNPRACRLASQQELSGLVIAEDEDGEWDGWDPPVEIERVHSQPLIHTRTVGQESGQTGLEEEAEVEEMILHSLLEDRVSSGLTDDQICPLDDNNRHEESSMASVLQDLSVSISPFLAIGILEVIDCGGVPGSSDSK